MVLTVFLLLGLLSFLYGYLKEKKFFYMLAAAFLGLAVLTKGPVYIMLAAAAILAFLFFTGGLKSLAKMPLFQSALVFMAVALPWYIIVYRLHGSAFTDAFFGFHNVNRFLEAEHKIGSQIYYNVPVALGGFFPWSAFLPFGLWYLIRQLNPAYGRKDTERKGIIFALVWLAVIFGFFTASSTKLPTYIFPCFISLALIVGVLLEDFVQGIRDAFAGTTVSYFILVIIIIAGSLIAPLAVKSKYPALSHGIAVSSAFLALGMIVSAFFFAAKRYMAALVLIVYAVVIFLYPLSALVIEPIERLETSKDTAERLVKLMAPGDRLGSESNYLAGLAFYTGIAPSDLDKHHDMVNFMNSGERVWVVMKEKNHVQLYDPVVNPLYVKPSYVVHKAGKRAIVTNEAPSGGKYLARRQRP
jgi:4-amino-4-deoxy-L-arabinose transferase-like glycosyltransferase